MADVTRSCYCVAVALHPATFRERFSVELLETFDLARTDYGVAALFADIVRSLPRQWCRAVVEALRGEQPCPGCARGGVLSGRYQPVDATGPRSRRVLESCLLMLAMIAPLILLAMMARLAHDRLSEYGGAFDTASITYVADVRGEPPHPIERTPS